MKTQYLYKSLILFAMCRAHLTVRFLINIIFFISTISLAQKIPNSTVAEKSLLKQVLLYKEQGNYKKVQELLKKTEQIYRIRHDTINLIDNFYRKGNAHYYLDEFSTAHKAYLTGYELCKAKHFIPDTLLVRIYISLANTYADLHNQDSSRYFATNAFDVIKHTPQLEKNYAKTLAAFFENQASSAIDTRDYQLAETYLRKALALAAQYPIYKANIFSHFANLYLKTNALAKADSTINIAIITYPKQDAYLAWYELLAARIQLQSNKPAETITHLRKAQVIYQSLPIAEDNNHLLRNIYLRFGQYYATQAKQDSAAIASFEKAIQISIKYYNKRGKIPAEACMELGKLYVRQAKYEAALAAIQQGIIAASATFNATTIQDNPNANDYILGTQLFEVLRLKAQLLAKDKPSLALQTYRRALEVAFRLRREISSMESKLFFQQSRVDEVFAEALSLAYKLDDSENFLWLMEQSQAATLGDLLSGNSLKASYLPPKVLEQEALLTSKITELKMALSQKADAKKEAELHDAQLAMERFELELSQNYPKYVQAKLLDKKISIKDIQQQLAEEMAYVAFYVSKNRIFTLVINKQNVKILSNALNTSEYESQVKLLRAALDHDPKIGKYTGEKASQYLYKTLFAPIEKLLEGKTRLIISRNSKLNLIPIEVLAFDPKRYLIEKFAISYAYNASLQFSKKSSVWGKPSLFVFAPFAKPSGQFAARGDTLKYLPATVNECRKLGGTLYSNDHARKTTFLETQRQQAQEGGAAIFHFATHSVIDSLPEKSFVAFHPSDNQEFRLFTTEIQNLNLSNIKLAVLNSCSSAYGQLLENEGLLSLGRAFTQAGCKSVAAALWEQNDESGSAISVSFHQYLAAGLPTDVALQKAKLDYLKQPHADAFRDLNHPYYWAALVLYGDASPAYDSTWWLPYLLVGVGALLVLLMGWLFWKRMGR